MFCATQLVSIDPCSNNNSIAILSSTGFVFHKTGCNLKCHLTNGENGHFWSFSTETVCFSDLEKERGCSFLSDISPPEILGARGHQEGLPALLNEKPLTDIRDAIFRA